MTVASMDMRAPSGVTIVERNEGAEAVVELFAPDGALLVEYRPGEDVLRIRAPRVEVEAEQDLRLAAGRSMRMEAPRGVTLASGDTRVAVRPGVLGLLAEALEASGTRAEWKFERIRVAADLVETEARRAVRRVGQLETNARQLVERTRESFREVSELAQTKAGRLRLVAEDTLHAMGRRTRLKAREDLKLRGERIHLD